MDYKGVCWYCSFPSPSFVRIPTENSRPYGYFCTWSCALTHLRDEAHPLYRMRCPSLIYRIDRRASLAPKKWTLTKFGGTLSIEQFRNYMALKAELRGRQKKKRKGFVFTTDLNINAQVSFNSDGVEYLPPQSL